MRKALWVLLWSMLVVSSVSAQEAAPHGPTLNAILSRGELLCGVNANWRGFGFLDANTGQIRGFEVDICRALAVAILGDPAAATLIPYNDASGVTDLQSGMIDILLHNMVVEPSGVVEGLDFGPIVFYDGQTLMVRDNRLLDWPDLNGGTICAVLDDAQLTTEITRRGLQTQVLTFETPELAAQALQEGRCEAQSGTRVQLELLRSRAADPSALTIWSRLYSHEPIAPLLRYGDQQWTNIVRWVIWGLIRAEELGVNSESVASFARASTAEFADVYVKRVGADVAHLLDWSLVAAHTFGLAPDAMVNVLRDVGNYGEIFARNLGATGDLPMERGLNNLSAEGGLMYAPGFS